MSHKEPGECPYDDRIVITIPDESSPVAKKEVPKLRRQEPEVLKLQKQLIKVRHAQIPHVEVGQNPLLKNKGSIKDDWIFTDNSRKGFTLIQSEKKLHKRNFTNQSLGQFGRQYLNKPSSQIKRSEQSSPESIFNIVNSNNSDQGGIPKFQGNQTTQIQESNNKLINDNSFDLVSKDQLYKNSLPCNELSASLKQKLNDRSESVSKKEEDNRSHQLSSSKESSIKKLPRQSFSNFICQLYNKIMNSPKERSINREQLDDKEDGDEERRFNEIIIEDPEEQFSDKIAKMSSLRKSQKYLERKSLIIRGQDILLSKITINKMMTQKELILKSNNFEDLQRPQTYVYLTKGLTNNSQDEDLHSIKNYRSAFFENDQDLENYHKQLKEALKVQFQTKINISHEKVRDEYEIWIDNLKEQLEKVSPFKKTLVFDLDETLVRADRIEPKNGYDNRITVIDQEANEQSYIYVKFRPYLQETLSILKEHFELILFTAASDQYADIVLQSFSGHQYFDHVLSRKHCLYIFQHHVFVKDLSILLNKRSLRDIIIVDNKIESYSSNLENGVPITSYMGQDDDDMLQKLGMYLLRLKDDDDVRETILKDFFLKNIANGMQKTKIYDTVQIKQCVLQARDNYQKQEKKQLQNNNFLKV